jgi:hypothetical protein
MITAQKVAEGCGYKAALLILREHAQSREKSEEAAQRWFVSADAIRKRPRRLRPISKHIDEAESRCHVYRLGRSEAT